MTLESSRLLLREFEESDWQAFHEYAANPTFLRYMPWDPPGEEQIRQIVRRMKRGKEDHPPHYDFAVVHKSDRRLIGSCSIIIAHDERQQGELGFAYNPLYWGKGYATEAAHLIVDYGFSELKLHRIFATTRPENIGSWRVLETVGLRREGLLRQHRWIRDSWQDSFLYAILNHEWKARQDSRHRGT